MKYTVVVLLLLILLALTSAGAYVYGYNKGLASCPVKYAVCENGTCTLSDVPPAGITPR
jgi:hypothetical protein